MRWKPHHEFGSLYFALKHLSEDVQMSKKGSPNHLNLITRQSRKRDNITLYVWLDQFDKISARNKHEPAVTEGGLVAGGFDTLVNPWIKPEAAQAHHDEIYGVDTVGAQRRGSSNSRLLCSLSRRDLQGVHQKVVHVRDALTEREIARNF